MTSVQLVSGRIHRDGPLLARLFGICLSIAAASCGTHTEHLGDIDFCLCRIESVHSAGLISLNLPQDGTTVYAEREGTVLGAADVKAIHICSDPITQLPSVEIVFTAAGGTKLNAKTSQEVGNMIGVVVKEE